MESTSKTKSDLKGRGSGEKYLQHKIKNYSKPTAIFKIKFISCGLKSICPFKKLATFLSLRNQSPNEAFVSPFLFWSRKHTIPVQFLNMKKTNSSSLLGKTWCQMEISCYLFLRPSSRGLKKWGEKIRGVCISRLYNLSPIVMFFKTSSHWRLLNKKSGRIGE